MEPRVRLILRELPGLDLSRAKVAKLHGGITNENFLVTAGRDRFVLRVSGKGGEQLGIDRTRERRCAGIVARLGVGAEIVARVDRRGATLSRFIDGRPLSATAAGTPAVLKRVVRALRKYHDGPAFPGVFTPFAAVRRCRALALRSRVALPREAERALAAMHLIERTLGPCKRRRPCHNDLLSGNLLDDGKTIRIIDWEYAAMGDPFFDLGNYAANLRLGPAARRLLLKEYFGRAARKDVERLELNGLASDLREAFWGFAQAGVSKLDFDFKSYAVKHLKRFMWGASRIP